MYSALESVDKGVSFDVNNKLFSLLFAPSFWENYLTHHLRRTAAAGYKRCFLTIHIKCVNKIRQYFLPQIYISKNKPVWNKFSRISVFCWLSRFVFIVTFGLENIVFYHLHMWSRKKKVYSKLFCCLPHNYMY